MNTTRDYEINPGFQSGLALQVVDYDDKKKQTINLPETRKNLNRNTEVIVERRSLINKLTTTIHRSLEQINKLVSVRRRLLVVFYFLS
jgi:hypothetical protein